MSYNNLYDIYDIFTDGFDHSEYLDRIVEKFGIDPKIHGNLALDCGCGTGTLLLELYKRGYDCTGVDFSESMLAAAEEKLSKAGYKPHLIYQDLTMLDLFGAYNIAFCTLDTINHITDKRGLKRFMKNLYNFIEPGGLFIFDVKTLASFKKTKEIQIIEREYSVSGDYGENLNIENTMIMRGGFTGVRIWYDLTLFRTDPENPERFQKIETYVEERLYTAKELKDIMADAGFTFADRFNYKSRVVYAFKKD